MSWYRELTLFVVAIAVSLMLSYGAATLGEPRASWLWCDTLSACGWLEPKERRK